MATKYQHKLNVLTSAVTWQVAEKGLNWHNDQGESGFVACDNITNVRMRFEPSRYVRNRVGLHFYAPIQYHISNSHYEGAMKFKDQTPEFKKFVTEFHNMFPPNTPTEFRQGSTKTGFIFNIIITLAILAFLLFLAPLISAFGIGSGGTNIFRIILIVIFLPLLFKSIVLNKPKIYRPDKIPMHLFK